MRDVKIRSVTVLFQDNVHFNHQKVSVSEQEGRAQEVANLIADGYNILAATPLCMPDTAIIEYVLCKEVKTSLLDRIKNFFKSL